MRSKNTDSLSTPLKLPQGEHMNPLTSCWTHSNSVKLCGVLGAIGFRCANQL